MPKTKTPTEVRTRVSPEAWRRVTAFKEVNGINTFKDALEQMVLIAATFEKKKDPRFSETLGVLNESAD